MHFYVSFEALFSFKSIQSLKILNTLHLRVRVCILVFIYQIYIVTNERKASKSIKRIEGFLFVF